jgi:hypothetical protein
MMRTVAHFLPFAALAGGILILLMPRLLNYVVAAYLILVGAIGLNNLHPLRATEVVTPSAAFGDGWARRG